MEHWYNVIGVSGGFAFSLYLVISYGKVIVDDVREKRAIRTQAKANGTK